MYLSLVTVPFRSDPRLSFRPSLAVAADAGLAAAFLATWLSPARLGPDAAGALALTLVLEFFAIHGAGFLGVAAIAPFPTGLRAAIVAALGVVFMLILWPLARVTATSWMVWAFWALVLNRLWALAEPALDDDLRSSQPLQDEWLAVGVRYVALAFVLAFLPVPGPGPLVDGSTSLPGRGLWLQTPQQAMALGTLYYGISTWRRATRRPSPPVEPAIADAESEPRPT